VLKGPRDAAADHGKGRWGALFHPASDCSVNALVRIEAADRAGRERQLRYCTRQPFA
jgi:hypothetical protein